MYTCMYVYMYICIYVYMYICIYVYMYICIYVYMHVCIYIHISLSLYIYIYRYRYLYTYIHTHMPVFSTWNGTLGRREVHTTQDHTTSTFSAVFGGCPWVVLMTIRLSVACHTLIDVRIILTQASCSQAPIHVLKTIGRFHRIRDFKHSTNFSLSAILTSRLNLTISS